MHFTFAPVADEAPWDAFVLKHSPSALFQSWSWGTVQEREGLSLWRIGMFDGPTLAGVMFVTKVCAKRGTFLHVRHGPVFATFTNEMLGAAVGELRRMAKQEGALFIRMNPLLLNSPENIMLLKDVGGKPAAIHAMDAELCWVLDLTPSEDELLQNMRKTTRYEIKQGQKFGVEVVASEDPKGLPAFFALYEQTAQRHGFVGHKGIKEEFEVFAKQGNALLYIARHEGKVLASAIVLFWGGQAIYRHGASLTSKVPASYLIQWKTIMEAKKRGMEVYNFWGIAPEDSPSHPWRGISLFKKGFGGRQVEYIHAHDIPISPLYLVARTIELIRKIRKGY